MNSTLILSREQVRRVDRIAIEDYQLPGIVLMENAALGVVAAVMDLLGKTPSPNVAILCGSGNNGGDGFAVARHLLNRRFHVDVFLLGDRERIAGDAKINLRVIEKMGLTPAPCSAAFQAVLSRSDLIIDALFGTGLTDEVRPRAKKVIETINAAGKPVLAVDIPSGLHCDTGKPLGIAVRAKTTVTFVARKRGFTQSGAEKYTGNIIVASIGAPRDIMEKNLQS